LEATKNSRKNPRKFMEKSWKNPYIFLFRFLFRILMKIGRCKIDENYQEIHVKDMWYQLYTRGHQRRLLDTEKTACGCYVIDFDRAKFTRRNASFPLSKTDPRKGSSALERGGGRLDSLQRSIQISIQPLRVFVKFGQNVDAYHNEEGDVEDVVKEKRLSSSNRFTQLERRTLSTDTCLGLEVRPLA